MDNQFRYKLLMSRNICTSEHFRDRYKKRVSKSPKKALEFARSSYLYGKDSDSLENKKLERCFRKGEWERGRVCKIYRGFVCWFDYNRAITVYPLPIVKHYNKEIKYDN